MTAGCTDLSGYALCGFQRDVYQSDRLKQASAYNDTNFGSRNETGLGTARLTEWCRGAPVHTGVLLWLFISSPCIVPTNGGNSGTAAVSELRWIRLYRPADEYCCIHVPCIRFSSDLSNIQGLGVCSHAVPVCLAGLQAPFFTRRC